MRTCKMQRVTKETKISCSLNLDGSGQSKIATGIGFFNHMLELFTFHANFDLELMADGDLDVCDHHIAGSIYVVEIHIVPCICKHSND